MLSKFTLQMLYNTITSFLFISCILEWISKSLEVKESTFFVLQGKRKESLSSCLFSISQVNKERNMK